MQKLQQSIRHFWFCVFLSVTPSPTYLCIFIMCLIHLPCTSIRLYLSACVQFWNCFFFFDSSAGLCTNVHTIYITCSAQYPSRTWPNSKKFCNRIIFPPPGEYSLPIINSANAHWYAHSHMVSRLSTAKHLSTWRPVTNDNACHPHRPHPTLIGPWLMIMHILPPY